jgi:spore maturation protein CgeB
LSRAITKGWRIYDRICGMLDNRSVEVLAEEEVEKHFKSNAKTILCVGSIYDYEKKNMGLSYEHYHFYDTLLRMNYSLIYCAYDKIKLRFGKERMSKMLREVVYRYHPDILFYLHYHDWISHELLTEFSNELPLKTVIWLTDDHVDYEYERPVWELFNIIVTTDRPGYERRKAEGFDVFLSQWACNHNLYRKMNLPKVYDVCFVGRCYGGRKDFVETLKRKGISIAAFGIGWENSQRISQSDLVKIFNQSKIILDISFSAKDSTALTVKGRVFEAAGCGSLLLTQHTKGITEFFIPNEEVVTYQDVNDAAEKIKYYLANEDERERIAKRGYERVLKDHTWEKRLLDIFNYALRN